MSNLEMLCSGGTTVCPGAASGPVFRLRSTEDLSHVPDGAVLVAPLPFPGLVTVMGKVGALVTHVGSTASHMATLAREFGIPTLVGLEHSCEFPEGERVTVDATGRAIYKGDQPGLVKARRTEFECIDEAGIYGLLRGILKRIAPLNLLHPDDDNFKPENCQTFHDITRLVHQMAMKEMFSLGKNIKHKDRIALRLKSGIPLNVLIIFIDQSVSEHKKRHEVHEDDIASIPMKAFWGGIKQEGWPEQNASLESKRYDGILPASLATKIDDGFSESSFAVLSEEYMILSLRLGYHFTTVEAMCTHTASNNYIRYQCKGGGATLEKRKRRIHLFRSILTSMGFHVTGKGDFMDARIAYRNHTDLADLLHLLGRLTMMTKQLDMALSNDFITRWYIGDIKRKLGIEEAAGGLPISDEGDDR
ncbi:MAG: PEP-utilizing enzyme [bacterium]